MKVYFDLCCMLRWLRELIAGYLSNHILKYNALFISSNPMFSTIGFLYAMLEVYQLNNTNPCRFSSRDGVTLFSISATHSRFIKCLWFELKKIFINAFMSRALNFQFVWCNFKISPFYLLQQVVWIVIDTRLKFSAWNLSNECQRISSTLPIFLSYQLNY